MRDPMLGSSYTFYVDPADAGVVERLKRSEMK